MNYGQFQNTVCVCSKVIRKDQCSFENYNTLNGHIQGLLLRDNPYNCLHEYTEQPNAIYNQRIISSKLYLSVPPFQSEWGSWANAIGD